MRPSARSTGPAPFRDRWLRDQGVRTVRIAAVDVRDNLDGVVQMIVLVARGEWEG
ncbi:hypothetical protein ACO2Q3_16055 [Caulobacter sp. KR2-114]|uniref:hypothetical protein n=1 Tax=Caulobacter sp. KR2-114 TaxID=3400912 RepID=UPI003BFE9525